MNKAMSIMQRALLLAALVLALPGAIQAADTPFAATAISDHIWRIAGPAGNTLVAADSDGLILIEGVPAAYADDYLAFVRELTGTDRIKTLVNTHWHPESAGLNATLAPTGTEVIAHANTRQWLGAVIRERGIPIDHTPVPEAHLPETVFHDAHTLAFRGGSIELGFLLQAHTDGDIYARFPQQNILFTGPVLREDGWAVVDETTNGFIGGLMDAQATLAGLIDDETVIVPASGELMDKAGYDAQQAMYAALIDDLKNLLRESRSAEEVVLANPARDLRPEWGDPSAFLEEGFRSYYGHLRNTRHVGVMP